MKRNFLLPVIFVAIMTAAQAQEITTAAVFFGQVSDRYGAVKDYEAKVAIVQGKTTMGGTIRYKNPNKVRIDFTDPANQVINSDGKTLTIYLPRYSVSFTQDLKKRSDAAIASMASKQGLNLLKNNYSIAYAVGPEPVPLDDGPGKNEKVTKLKLTWRSAGEAFRQLEISVGDNGFIRRIAGVTAGYKNIQFDFSAIRTNLGLPDNRFDYDVPASSNKINNFLFDPEE